MLSGVNAIDSIQRLRDDVFRVDSDAEVDDDEPSTATQARIIAENSKSDMTPSISRTIMSSRGEGVPLSKQGEHKTPPTWIRSNAQLIKNRPSLKLDTLSMHVMDHGAGPNALVTIRAIDDEKHSSKLSLEERSRCGVLGRMLDSIWTKLLLVRCRAFSLPLSPHCAWCTYCVVVLSSLCVDQQCRRSGRYCR